MENNKTPKIRFKGFTAPWEQRKLGDIVKEVTRTEPSSGAPIMMITANNGFIEQSERYAFNNAGESLKKYILLEKGELAYNHGASKLRPYGSCFALTTRENARIPFVYHCFSADEQNSEFLSIELNGTDVENQLRRIVSSGARMDGLLNISFQEYASVSVLLPSIEEQNKIASFFNSVDRLITLHQRKYNKLLNVKKSMLEKMFPKNGSNIPEIRFKGFTDPWEQRKLLSCIEKITDFRGRTPKKLGMDWSESGYLALSALNVKDGYIDFSQDVHYGDQALYDKWMSGNELHKGQVLFTTEAPMGNVAQVPDNKQYILSQRTIAFDVKEDIITENFLATLLRSPAVFNTLTSLSSGGTAKGVSQKSLAGVDIQIPVELREQELLATYFSNLDNLITLHQRELEKLQNIKKSMLEKMFV